MMLNNNQTIQITAYNWIVSNQKLTQWDRNGLFFFKGGLFHYQLTDDPENLCSNFPNVVHYLKHFWLLLPDSIQDQQLFWSQFYSLYSPTYLDLIDSTHNLACMYYFKTLLEKNVGPFSPEFKLLDYGCGPGLSAQIFGVKHLIGYDNNSVMLKKATEQGLQIVDRQGFNNIQPCFFDAAFACYVFHMAIPESDIMNIVRVLKPDGVFIANYYKNFEIERVTSLFQKFGAEGEKVNDSERRFGSVYIYRKRFLFSSFK